MGRSEMRCARLACLVAVAAWLAVTPANAEGEAAPGLASTTGESGRQEKTPAEQEPKRAAKPRKGGVNPCNTPDPGFGIYDKWSRNVSMGQMLAPQRGGLTKGGGFDLIVHFHGHEAIRKEFVRVANGAVLIGIDLGIGSGAYSSSFASPHVFEHLLESAEREMARRNGRKKAFVRKLALSAWSAGYGAIEQILRQPAGKKVDAVVLLDALHTGYNDADAKDIYKRLNSVQIEPFVEFARKAAGGQKVMFQSHSSIPPPGYASTREVSQFIVKKLGGKLHTSKRDDVLGLEMFERYDRGGYHARGYRGDDKPDHCAHLGLIRSVVRVHLKPRWNSPRGRRGKPVKAKEEVATAKVETKVEAKAVTKRGNVHVVTSGESLGRIARRHDITVAALREANGLVPGGRKIQPGDELVIPAPGARVEKPKDKPKEAQKEPKKEAKKEPKKDSKKESKEKSAQHKNGKQPGERVHVVEKGDALIPIAKRYGITVKALRARNGLQRNGRSIQPGEELIIPAAN